MIASHSHRTAENSAAYLLPHLRPGDALLDVGSGAGTITVGLADRVARCVGLDVSEDVVQQAAARHRRPGLTWQVASVDDLPFPDASFDVVHAHQVLQHLGDPVAALREMTRVLRPDGVVAVRDADYSAMTWYPEVPHLQRWREMYLSVARHLGGEPDAARRLRSWCLAAGLIDLECSADTWCFSAADDRAWWADTWVERTTSTSLAQHAQRLVVADHADLRAMADGWRIWRDCEDGWFAVLHGQVLARNA